MISVSEYPNPTKPAALLSECEGSKVHELNN